MICLSHYIKLGLKDCRKCSIKSKSFILFFPKCGAFWKNFNILPNIPLEVLPLNLILLFIKQGWSKTAVENLKFFEFSLEILNSIRTLGNVTISTEFLRGKTKWEKLLVLT